MRTEKIHEVHSIKEMGRMINKKNDIRIGKARAYKNSQNKIEREKKSKNVFRRNKKTILKTISLLNIDLFHALHQ